MKSPKNTRLASAAAGAILIGTLLTGCATTAPAAAPTSTSPTSAATTAPAALPEVYFRDTDTYLPVDPALPIPENVIEAVRATTTEKAAAVAALNLPSDGASTPEQRSTITESLDSGRALSANLSEATGRTVFVVFHTWGGNDAGVYGMVWVSTSESTVTGVRGSPDKDAVVEGITAWVAAQPDPSAYEIVVT